MVENGELTADNFADILGLTFDHCGLDGERVELYLGGGNRDVELADVREYVSLRLKVSHWKSHCCNCVQAHFVVFLSRTQKLRML